MDKFKCYHYLLEIKKQGTNIDEQVKLIAGKDKVPLSVVKFIHQYIPQDSMTTLEHIHSKRHKNPLYKNLVNENATIEDKAIALSSLLTQSMIGLKNIDEKNRSDYSRAMMISDITGALEDYSFNQYDLLLEVFDDVRKKIKEVY